MKKNILVLAIITSMLNFSFVSDNLQIVDANYQSSQTRKTGTYDKISTVGSITVKLVKGTEGTITVSGDADKLDLVVTEVKNNSLHIGLKPNQSYKNIKKLLITVPVTDVNSISLNGSGTISSDFTLTDEKLDLTLIGSGDIDLNVDNKKVVASLTGSGDIEVKGKTDVLEGYLNGSGDLEFKQLNSKTSTLVVSGSGDAESTTLNKISASVLGSGSITIYGKPEKVSKSVNGSGSIYVK